MLFTFNEKGEKEFIGISMKYFKDYISIDELDKINDVDAKTVFLNLISSLRELTDNNVYPTDLNNKNILVSPSFDIQIIDLDGEYCIVSDKEESNKLQEIFDRLLYCIYSYVIEDFPEIQQEVRRSGYGYKALLLHGYSEEFVKMLLREETITYEKLINIINQYFPNKNKTL